MATVEGMATAMARATTAGLATTPRPCGGQPTAPVMAAGVATTATVVSVVVTVASTVALVVFTEAAGAVGGKLSARSQQ